MKTFHLDKHLFSSLALLCLLFFSINNEIQAQALITCPVNITVPTDSGQCSAEVAYSVCVSGPGSLVQSQGSPAGSAFSLGVTANTYVFTDANGDSDTCTFSITVEDTVPPIFTVCNTTIVEPVIHEYNCFGQVNPYVRFTDDCSISTIRVIQDNDVDTYTFSANNYPTGWSPIKNVPIGNSQLIIEVSDHSNNTASCVIDVTIVDPHEPEIYCPSSTSIQLSSGCDGTYNYRSVGTYDACGIDTLIQTSGLPAGGGYPLGETVNSFTVTDVNGNTNSCSFYVWVYDDADPTISCPNNMVVDTDSGSCDAVVNFTVSAVDNCNDTITIGKLGGTGLDSGDTFPLGSTYLEYVAEDSSGNRSSCDFFVTVQDNEAPVMDCPSQIIQYSDSASCDTVVSFSVGATDNCSASFAQTDNSGLGSGDIFPVGTTRLSYQATDAAGNTASCSFDVIVAPSAVSANTTEACTSSPIGLILSACGASSYRVNSLSHSTSCYVNSAVNSFPDTILADGLAADVAYISGGNAEVITYNVTPISADGVAGLAQDISITVNSAPQSISGLFAIACGGQAVNADLALGQTPASGITYSWTAVLPLDPHVSIVAGSNSGSTHIIDDVIHNSDSVAQLVAYQYRLTQGSCSSANYLIYFYVYPDASCSSSRVAPVQHSLHLPLNLQANQVNVHDVQLHWNQHHTPMPRAYVIEKQRNDGQFETLAELQTLPFEMRYAYMDESGMGNKNTYRIKLIFESGLAIYSEEVEVTFEYVEAKFSLYPNPMQGKCMLRAPYNLDGSWQFEISDRAGRSLQSGLLTGQETAFDIHELPAATYFLVITSPTGKRFIKKMVKN